MYLALAKLLQNYNLFALASSEMGDATPFATNAKGVWINTPTRCRMSDSGRPYSYLRSVSLVSLDALGAPEYGWSLHRFLERCYGLTLFPLGYLLDALTKPRA
jgi:hypothetical protein